MKKTVLLCLVFTAVFTCGINAATKTVFIPPEFTTLGLDWDMSRSYESANFVIFWGTIAGADPMTAPDTTLRFNPANVCATLESIYTKFITEIQFCSDDPAKNLGKYKCIIMMNNTFSSPNGPTGWAFGGTYSNTIGAMWVHPQSTADGVVISHEFAHSMQGMINIQENAVGGGYVNWEPAGFFWECHANYMRAQMYSAAAFAYDMPRWLATSMFHWSSTRHHYDSFRPLYVVQEQYGIEMVNRMWKESLNREHPLLTLRRLLGWTQPQLNDFMYGYAKREITSDYPVNGFGTIIKNEMTRLKNNEPHYLWRQYSMLKRVDGFNDRFIVPDEFAPQDYGYNVVPLYPANASLPVCVKFKGHTEANTYAGWRYGIVSVTTGGEPRYAAVNAENEKEFSFQPLADENAWYLVVSGAPVTHTSYVWEPGWPKIKRYPYEIRLVNAVPEGWQANFRADIRAKYAGHVHPNGGGWTANSATVADTVYVGPRAVVLGNSNISGAVSISGTAWVDNAAVSGNVIIDGNARVRGGNISQNVRVTDNAILYNCTVSGTVIAKGNTFDWGSTFSGASVVGGDAEIGSATVDGVYLQCPHVNNGRAENDGKGATDVSNVDVNAVITPFADAVMQFAGGCAVSTPTMTVSSSQSPVYSSTTTATPTRTPSLTITVSSSTPTATTTPTVTLTRTPSATVTVSSTASRVSSSTPTATTTPTATLTRTPSATVTVSSTASRVSSSTATATTTSTATLTRTLSATMTATSFQSASVTASATADPVSSATMTATTAAAQTPSETPTLTLTLTLTLASTITATPTLTNSFTMTITITNTPLFTFTRTVTLTLTLTSAVMVTETPSFSVTQTPSPAPSPSATRTQSPVPSISATRTPQPATPTLSIDDVVLYPNPYRITNDLKISMEIKGLAETIKVRIYTAAFRIVAEETETGVFSGSHVINVNSRKLFRLASGSYYVIVSASSRGITARSGAVVMTIIRK